MRIKDGEYIPEDSDEFFEFLSNSVVEQKSDANPNAEYTVIHGLLTGFSETLANTTELNLQEVYQSGYVVDATGKELTKKAEELGFIRREPVKATGVVEFSRNSAATSDYTISQGTVVETGSTDPVQYETTEEVTLVNGTTSVQATIEAVEGGVDGNVGANTVDVMPSPPTGIGSVTNPDPVGDSSYTDTSGDPLRIGRDRESDTELQNRILRDDGGLKSASSDDIETSLSELEGVIDTTAVVNASSDDNTASGGLPPYSTEIVVQGGDSLNIVETLYETMSHIDFRRLYAGTYGTEVTESITDNFIQETITGRFSRPTEVDPKITVDMVVLDGEFAGTDTVKDEIIKYAGGITTDDEKYIGLTLGENLYESRIETAATDVSGVRGTTSITIDKNGDGTDDTTTDSEGLSVLSIAKTETVFLQTNDITINTTVV